MIAAAQRLTPLALLEETIARLRDGAQRFAKLDLRERIRLAHSMRAGYLRVAERTVHAGCAAKGVALGTPGEGEEWLTGPCCVLRHLRLVCESLVRLERGGNTPIGSLGRTVDGRLLVQTFPASRFDSLLSVGARGEVHLQSGVTESELEGSRASFYRRPDHDGQVVLVLGAGNLHSIPVGDVVTKLFNEGKVCILKMHPVNAYLGPFIEEAFLEAVANDFLAVVYGDAEVGAYLAQHPGVDEIHITGSDKTFDLLVWGPPGPIRAERMRRGTTLLNKRISGELGNVSPVILLPGPYTDSELEFQAESIAGAVTSNASFNCNAARVLVTPKGWAKRDVLLGSIECCFRETPLRSAYYPGAADRWLKLTAGREHIRTTGSGTRAEPTLPWTLVSGLDASDPDEPAFSTEAFCPILFETSVGDTDPIGFLEAAVAFANQRLWGTLVATLIVHPKVMASPAVAEAVERAIVRLRYGGVGVNVWPALIYYMGSMPWGGHPSATLSDIQSGCGWVHNTTMLERVEKAVARLPFVTAAKPPYFPSHKTAHLLGRRLTFFEGKPSVAKLPGLIGAAIRG